MKNLLKYMLVPILASRPASKLGAMLFGNNHIPVFMLHRMHTGTHPYTGPSPDYLRRCLKYLVENDYNFVSLEDIIVALNDKKSLPPKSVAFTIDDGYWDQAEISAPIFYEFNCPATLFVITGMLDGILWPWDAKVTHLIDTSATKSLNLSLGDKTFNLPLTTTEEKNVARKTIDNHIKALDANDTDKLIHQLASATGSVLPDKPPQHFKPMTWDTARQLEQNGLKIAPHTVSHRMLSKLNKKTSEQEIAESWQRLKDELSSPSPIFCYPTGRDCDYGVREIDFLKKNGFIGAVSTTPSHVTKENSSLDYKYNLPRFSFPKEYEDFIQYCSWIENMKNKFRSYNKP